VYNAEYLHQPLTVNMGSDWRATDLWSANKPIILIGLRSLAGEILKSRFDFAKGIFIDPIPVAADEESTESLLSAIKSNSQPSPKPWSAS
jgi:hypothetical protein